jgi:hypothetical protein
MFSARHLVRSRAVGLAAVGAMLIGGLTLSSAEASTPSEGTVSDTATTATWSGGPFAVPNVTAEASGTPDCTVPSSCDDFTLHVSTPAGYGDTHQLVVKVGWPQTAADFDVYVLDAAGNTVATAASSADPEQVTLPTTTADYTVRVVPFAPLGQSYDATATLSTKPANPAPGTDTPPGFATYAAPASFSGANDAGEPSIGTNWKSGATMYQSGLSTAKVTFDDTTSPATASWTDVSASATNGCPQGSTTSLDPILFTDHETGRTFESQLSGVDSLTCYTDNDGASWSPSQGGGIPSGVDHQTVGGGHFSANGLGALPVSTYPNAVYYCSQDIATAFCAASRDGGTTFGAGVPTYSLLDCGGLHGHVKVAPDGTVYLPNKGCGSDQAAIVSTDNGTTWTIEHVPGSTPGDSDPSIGVGSNGTVYFGYTGADGKPGIAVSHDQGKTWEHNQTVGTEFGISNAVFPTVVAGDDDRASFAYLGTPTGGNYQDAANFTGIWHLYVDTTYDGGQTWVTSDATPNDPVQRGSICTAGTTCGNDRNLLDFIDMTIDDHGRVEVAYADGCIDACVSDPSQNNHDAYTTIARQSSGKTLFAQYDPAVTNVTLSSLDVTRQTDGSLLATMLVKNTGNQPVTGVSTQVLDGRKQVGLSDPLTLAAGASRTITVGWRTSNALTHTVTAVTDPQNTVAESDESDNKLQQTVRR